MSRKPWETPIIYNEDRFEPPVAAHAATDAPVDERTEEDVVELINRPQSSARDRDRSNYGFSNDDTPINYNKGPHRDELDVDDRDELGGDASDHISES